MAEKTLVYGFNKLLSTPFWEQNDLLRSLLEYKNLETDKVLFRNKLHSVSYKHEAAKKKTPSSQWAYSK